jgi:maltose-binding protein MalE
MKGKLRLAFAVLGASALLISACSDDSDSDSTTTSAAEETTTTINEKIMMLDADADGDVQFGVAAAGPANDGAYVQATVDGVKAFAEANGLPEPIVVDEIEAEQSAEKLEALAQQGADVIVVAATFRASLRLSTIRQRSATPLAMQQVSSWLTPRTRLLHSSDAVTCHSKKRHTSHTSSV